MELKRRLIRQRLTERLNLLRESPTHRSCRIHGKYHFDILTPDVQRGEEDAVFRSPDHILIHKNSDAGFGYLDNAHQKGGVEFRWCA